MDTDRYYVIVVDPFANGVSSSPSNSAAQHGTAFPVFTMRDLVRAEERLVRETLDLEHLHAVVGQSMGGMQVFAWVVDAPAMMDRAVSVVGTPQMSSYDLLLWSAEKQALETDPAYRHGQYTRNPALPMVAYLHQMNLATPAFRVDHTTREQFAEFLARTGAEMHTGTDANDYLRQLQAMLSQDIAHGGDLYAAARAVKAKMLIVNAEQDHMVNPIVPLAFARLIHAETVVLHSDCGHMAPGCELGDAGSGGGSVSGWAVRGCFVCGTHVSGASRRAPLGHRGVWEGGQGWAHSTKVSWAAGLPVSARQASKSRP